MFADKVRATPVARKAAREKNINLSHITGSGERGRIHLVDVTNYMDKTKIRITPLAEKIAKDLNIDTKTISGSGYKNKITKDDIAMSKEDVKRVKNIDNKSDKFTSEVPSSKQSEFNNVKGKHIPLSPMRETVAKRMTESYFTVPAFTMNMEIDITELIKLRKSLIESIKKSTDEKVTITDFIVLAVAKTLKNHPLLNAAWCEDSIFLYDEINIALAVGLEEGLFVPVIKDTDKKSISEITVKSKEIISKSLNGKLIPAEQESNTFTISNIGMYGINTFTPILNMPSSAILGVGATNERYVPINGNMEIRSIMNLSLTADHRVVDGTPACKFLKDLKHLLENPVEILV